MLLGSRRRAGWCTVPRRSTGSPTERRCGVRSGPDSTPSAAREHIGNGAGAALGRRGAPPGRRRARASGSRGHGSTGARGHGARGTRHSCTGREARGALHRSVATTSRSARQPPRWRHGARGGWRRVPRVRGGVRRPGHPAQPGQPAQRGQRSIGCPPTAAAGRGVRARQSVASVVRSAVVAGRAVGRGCPGGGPRGGPRGRPRGAPGGGRGRGARAHGCGYGYGYGYGGTSRARSRSGIDAGRVSAVPGGPLGLADQHPGRAAPLGGTDLRLRPRPPRPRRRRAAGDAGGRPGRRHRRLRGSGGRSVRRHRGPR